LKELDQEILTLLNKLGRARWTDVKRTLSEETKDRLSENIDTYMTRSLKRLEKRGYAENTTLGSYPRKRYCLTPAGNLVAYKIQHGIRVDDPLRDHVLAFGHTLQWLKNRAIIEADRDDVRDYFKCYQEAVASLDIDRFLDSVKISEDIMEDEEDPWDDTYLIKHIYNLPEGLDADKK
jgi:DNA-binding PadR family transcriptional regulator